MTNITQEKTKIESIIAQLEGLAEEAKAISVDDYDAFYGWEKRFKSICYGAGERSRQLCNAFYRQHSSKIKIVGESDIFECDKYAAERLKCAPQCIQSIIDDLKIYGIVPIKKRATKRSKNNAIKSAIVTVYKKPKRR